MPPFSWYWFIFWSRVASVAWKLNYTFKTLPCFGPLENLKYDEDKDLGEIAFLVNKRQQVHGFAGQYVQGSLVILVVNALPNNVFTGVLFLLKLEDVLDEELLQLLIGEVDAQLLKAAEKEETKTEA